MIPISATIEEFEQGAWVADIVALESFSGSFTMPDGETWTGFKLSEKVEHQKYHTRIIGGAGKLGVTVPDKYYSGNVSLGVALADLCRAAGETMGTATPGVFLSTYQRLAGITTEALDVLADAFSQIWWIDRTGTLQMGAARPVGAEASGQRVSSDSDGSAVLVNPVSLTLGASYAPTEPTAMMASIRHIRWRLTPERFQAEIFPLPFLFRSPAQTKYTRHYNASVLSDNGDGTVDVRVDNRFGVTAVPLLCGVPGAKVKTKKGEIVTLGFYGGDPQKPYCVAMGQNTGATKQVARNGDTVKVTLTALQIATISCASAPGPCAGGPIDIQGTITSGTPRMMVDDG